MAGSYRHIVRDDNSFRGIDLIENLGDAHEALEECYDIIQELARELSIHFWTDLDDSARKIIHLAWLHGHIKKRSAPGRNLEDPILSFDSFWNREDP